MFALQYFIFTHWVSTVGYATYIFWCFLLGGIGIRHDNDPPVSNQVSMSNLRGCQVSIQPVHNLRKPSLRESGTQFFRGKQLLKMCSTEWDGWRIFHRLDLEWPDCWNTTKQRYLTRMIVQWCITLNYIHCTSRLDIKALEFAQSSCLRLFTSEAMTPTSFQVAS